MKKGGLQQYTNSREYRNQVRFLIKDQLYKESYKLGFRWLQKMQHNLIDVTNEHMWACYYNLGVSMWGMEEYEKGIDFLNQSLKFGDKLSEKIKSKTTIAICEDKMGNKQKALAEYNMCISICDDACEHIYNTADKEEDYNNVLEIMASLLTSKGELLIDEEYIYESIAIYEMIKTKDKLKFEIIQKQIQKSYKKLCEMYINKNNIMLANKILKYINNKDIKEQLMNKMQA